MQIRSQRQRRRQMQIRSQRRRRRQMQIRSQRRRRRQMQIRSQRQSNGTPTPTPTHTLQPMRTPVSHFSTVNKKNRDVSPWKTSPHGPKHSITQYGVPAASL